MKSFDFDHQGRCTRKHKYRERQDVVREQTVSKKVNQNE